MSNKQYSIGCMPIVFMGQIIAGMCIVISCQKVEDPAKNISPVFIHNIYNDTIRFVTQFIEYPDPPNLTDSFEYDINNDGDNDFILRNELKYLDASQRVELVIRNNNLIFSAKDTLDHIFGTKSYATGKTINRDSFYTRNNIFNTYNVYLINPTSFLPTLGITSVDPGTGVFYYVFMETYPSSGDPRFAWLKMKFYTDILTSGFGIVIFESGYNVTPLDSIQTGQY